MLTHVAHKDELLDGMVDLVFAEIESPAPGAAWKPALRRRGRSVREALRRHRWAIGVLETRRPGPANLCHHDAVLGCLRQAGFGLEDAIHAYSAQDAYIYGFVLQEQTTGFEQPSDAGEAVQRRPASVEGAEAYPHLLELVAKLPSTGYDPAAELDWGLDLVVDGLERRLRRAARSTP